MGRPALVSPRQSAPVTPSREQLIDEFGELDRRIQDFAPAVRRHKQLTELIRTWYTDHPAEQPALAEGHVYRIQVSPRTEERSFSLAAKTKIFARLGKAKALELFSITLKAVEDALGKGDMESLVSKAHSGTRKLIPVLISPAERQQAA